MENQNGFDEDSNIERPRKIQEYPYDLQFVRASTIAKFCGIPSVYEDPSFLLGLINVPRSQI